ncbi:helix-turn-helix domain-containing protein [Streptomyces marispadix]|uniref:Helix-turn-helix domain-containing protein n=1 Tax=Streptomyces marispadix TaxID=2922868 RepID=A0ABS9SYY2_9ACTN|nr:helix-turn-helix domain-containing protein [Streptomyces marispadix]MCH6161480.1 helix-turn-helix domain-containing protein [Streptomyces marispadix]
MTTDSDPALGPHFGDVRAVADELAVHQNTVRQRLWKATDLFGVDLDAPAQRLVLELELRATELPGPVVMSCAIGASLGGAGGSRTGHQGRGVGGRG